MSGSLFSSYHAMVEMLRFNIHDASHQHPLRSTETVSAVMIEVPASQPPVFYTSGCGACLTSQDIIGILRPRFSAGAFKEAMGLRWKSQDPKPLVVSLL